MDSIKVKTEDLMTVGPAAKALSVSRVTIYNWIEAGKIVSIKLGEIVFIPKSEVDRIKAKEALSMSK